MTVEGQGGKVAAVRCHVLYTSASLGQGKCTNILQINEKKMAAYLYLERGFFVSLLYTSISNHTNLTYE